ncbi:patched domain-containing protein 3-like [Mercenaria mercenaria]|uniref:patched domain-containing protein 3-like n=1 Tax=Mercenaria mercenaria TaxID=6596 RepID=UPI00234F72EB|nr:patched domain-containing protein 3-like [Mercenaria mercenaria]XP_053403568.1 patched domain-containing protein 3-like [Mercenaria mercenaria]
MRLNALYELVERKIGGAFARYGRFVAGHAWKIIIVTIIVNGALGIGMIRLRSNIEAENVYLPQGTQARHDVQRMKGLFPDLSGSNFNLLQLLEDGAWAKVIIKSKYGNILNRTVLEEIGDMDAAIQNITAVADDGSIIRYSDICARVKNRCAVDGELFWDPEFLAAVDSNQVTYPRFTTSATGTTNFASDLGGTIVTDDTENYLSSAEFINLDYIIRTDGGRGGRYQTLAGKWVDEFKAYMESVNSKNFEVAYSHFNSMDEELDKNIKGDITLFSITMTLMITYACVATTSSRITDQVGQRMWLGYAGVITAGLAIVSSFGLCAAVGVHFVSIVGVIPFLIMGIGIDDMFILLSGLSGAQNHKTVEDKMAATMRASGVGITITSLTDLIAFMAGAGSNFIAVRNFCIYTGAAVIFCYINNITFFAACMAINERRVQENRHYGTCRRIKTKEELTAEGKSDRYIMCCGGRPPTNRDEAESFIDKLPRWLIPKIVLKTPFKIGIIVLFMAYLAASIYGCINLKQGLVFTQLVADDSYYYKYSDWDERYFTRQTPVSFVITKTYKYSDPNTHALIEDLIISAQSNNYFDNTFEVNWLKTYKATPYYEDSSEKEFISGFLSFINDTKYAMFENDVIMDTTKSVIVTSRVYVISADMADSQAEGDMMLKSREIANTAEIECFAFSPYFVPYEQYVAILGQTLRTVGTALAAVFVVTCLFMPHPVLIIFVTLAVTMIMTGVFGFLIYLDVALSSITMIHLIMSIGFSIDFTAHICHGYMISDGKTRDLRVKQAIDKTGAPIFHGAVSSILGIIVLIGAKSYIFRTFAAVMSFVLLFGIAHALLLLPVILSWIGPGRLNASEDSEIIDDNTHTQNGTDLVKMSNGKYAVDKMA